MISRTMRNGILALGLCAAAVLLPAQLTQAQQVWCTESGLCCSTGMCIECGYARFEGIYQPCTWECAPGDNACWNACWNQFDQEILTCIMQYG